ncbi:MAG TPA: hypothetical protein VM284_00160, partial [Candidatus Limnocylindria bacterium]|nr:hypothetical protein [Candidatus Limnocylindria bacterium]
TASPSTPPTASPSTPPTASPSTPPTASPSEPPTPSPTPYVTPTPSPTAAPTPTPTLPDTFSAANGSGSDSGRGLIPVLAFISLLSLAVIAAGPISRTRRRRGQLQPSFASATPSFDSRATADYNWPVRRPPGNH